MAAVEENRTQIIGKCQLSKENHPLYPKNDLSSFRFSAKIPSQKVRQQTYSEYIIGLYESRIS